MENSYYLSLCFSIVSSVENCLPALFYIIFIYTTKDSFAPIISSDVSP